MEALDPGQGGGLPDVVDQRLAGAALGAEAGGLVVGLRRAVAAAVGEEPHVLGDGRQVADHVAFLGTVEVAVLALALDEADGPVLGHPVVVHVGEPAPQDALEGRRPPPAPVVLGSGLELGTEELGGGRGRGDRGGLRRGVPRARRSGRGGDGRGGGRGGERGGSGFGGAAGRQRHRREQGERRTASSRDGGGGQKGNEPGPGPKGAVLHTDCDHRGTGSVVRRRCDPGHNGAPPPWRGRRSVSPVDAVSRWIRCRCRRRARSAGRRASRARRGGSRPWPPGRPTRRRGPRRPAAAPAWGR